MANGIKKWALTTTWKALHQGDVCFCVFSEKKLFFQAEWMNGDAEVQREADRDASLVDWEDVSAVMSSYTHLWFGNSIIDARDRCRNASQSLTIRHPKHLKRRLNEQSHPELRHKIQCERCFSTCSSGTRMRTSRKQLGGWDPRVWDYLKSGTS